MVNIIKTFFKLYIFKFGLKLSSILTLKSLKNKAILFITLTSPIHYPYLYPPPTPPPPPPCTYVAPYTTPQNAMEGTASELPYPSCPSTFALYSIHLPPPLPPTDSLKYVHMNCPLVVLYSPPPLYYSLNSISFSYPCKLRSFVITPSPIQPANLHLKTSP